MCENAEPSRKLERVMRNGLSIRAGMAVALAVALAVGLLAGLTPMLACAQSMPLENLDHFPRATLVIEAGGHVRRFRAWIADTTARQAQGLMFVRNLPADEGMIFPMHPPQVAQFWMANTYIPLDMLFVAPGGRIEKITVNAKPFSLKTISSGTPVEAVIEIGGGEARTLGITVGSLVRWTPVAAQ